MYLSTLRFLEKPPDRPVLSDAWLLVKSTEGMFSGITGSAQKQGSAEATPAGKKEKCGESSSKSQKYFTDPLHSF